MLSLTLEFHYREIIHKYLQVQIGEIRRGARKFLVSIRSPEPAIVPMRTRTTILLRGTGHNPGHSAVSTTCTEV